MTHKLHYYITTGENDINIIGKTKPDLQDLKDWLTENDEDNPSISYNISSKWQELGMALNLDGGVLTGIARRHDTDVLRLYAVLQHWLDNTSARHCNWTNMIKALDGPIVAKRITAEHVKERLSEDDIFESYKQQLKKT